MVEKLESDDIPEGLLPLLKHPPKWDKIYKHQDIMLSNDNRTCSSKKDDQYLTCLGDEAFPDKPNKYYFEVQFEADVESSGICIGISQQNVKLDTYLGGTPQGWSLGLRFGYKWHSGLKEPYCEAKFGKLDRVGVSLDRRLGTLSFYKNGVYLGVAYQNAIFKKGVLYPACSLGLVVNKVTFRDVYGLRKAQPQQSLMSADAQLEQTLKKVKEQHKQELLQKEKDFQQILDQKEHEGKLALEACRAALIKLQHKQLLVNKSRFSQQKLLGSSGFANVYDGVYLNYEDIPNNSMPVAIKQVNINLNDSMWVFQAMLNMIRTQSEFVVELFGFAMQQQQHQQSSQAHNVTEVYFLTQRMERSLEQAMDAQIQDYKKLQFLMEIANGLKHLHSLNIVHFNLKPSNILFDQKEKIKLSDVGIALSSLAEPSKMKNFTRKYRAPEIENKLLWQQPNQLQNQNQNEVVYSPKCDMWSFGVILYEVISGKPAWAKCTDEQVNKIFKTKENLFSNHTKLPNDELQTLVEKCLSYIADNRPTAQEAHDVLVNLKYDQQSYEFISNYN